VLLESRPKHYRAELHHSVPPVEALSWAMSRIDSSGVPLLRSIDDLAAFGAPGISVAKAVSVHRDEQLGKGLTGEQARVSAVMELVERFSGVEARNHVAMTRCPRDRLPGRSAGFDDLVACNVQHFIFRDPGTIDGMVASWIRAGSLTHGNDVWVPASRVLLRYSDEGIPDFSCSNGMAANVSLEEAIVQALCEVVERHVLHLVALNGPGASLRIDLGSVRNPSLVEALHRVQDAGYEVVANDHSSFTGIPTVSMLAWPIDACTEFENSECYVRFGTATDPEVALVRCLTEIVQTQAGHAERRLGKPALRREAPDLVQRELSWRRNDGNPVPATALPRLSHDDFRDEIEALVGALSRIGVEVILADLTDPRLRIPVVRMLCPGLQPNFIPFGASPFRLMARVSRHLECHEEVVQAARSGRFAEQCVVEKREVRHAA
jgi:ribosomal protein S12 methylthiotransferase accessory factor